MLHQNTLVLGRDHDGAPVHLNVEALIGSHLCIQANSGGGKSRTIRKIVELAEGHAQRIVIDVEDEFHTLRETSPRMVIAGPEGDCPATIANASALPLFILETGVDAVVQINSLGQDGRREFVAQFLEALISAPRSLWHPALVVLDETHRYVPQAGKVRSSAAVAALASEGRKRGYTAIFATQRMSKIDKDATGDINNWLMGRAGQAVDRERCAEELGLKKTSAEVRNMGRLNAGDFWGIGPAIAPEPTWLHVADPKTTHLRSGQRGVPVPPAPDEIRAMMAKLHVAPPPVPATDEAGKINTPRPAATADELAAAERRGFERGIATRMGALKLAAIDVRAALDAATDKVADAVLALRETTLQQFRALPDMVTAKAKETATSVQRAVSGPKPDSDKPKVQSVKATVKRADGVSPSARKILDRIHAAYPVPLTYGAAAARAGISPRSSKFGAYRREVVDSGEVESVGPGDRFCSKPGYAAPVEWNPATAIEDWASRLSPNSAKILRAVAAGARNKEQIAEHTGISITSSGLGKGITDLRNIALVEVENGEVLLTESLRPGV